MKITTTIIIAILCSCASYGQSYFKNGKYNRLGIQGRYAVFSVASSNIEIEGDDGFIGGFTTRGRLYNNWGMVYGIDFLSVNSEVATSGTSGLQDQKSRYTLRGAQLNLHASYNLIGQNLAIDIGPSLLVNGRMTLNDAREETNIVDGYSSLTAEDIQEVSRINPFIVVGITGGWENVRFMMQYQYGLTNFFGNYNDQDFNDPVATVTDFKGTASIISGGIVFYL